MKIPDETVIVDKIIIVPKHLIGQAIVIGNHSSKCDQDNGEPALGEEIFFHREKVTHTKSVCHQRF